MAVRELFKSRETRETADGWTGQRKFLADWSDAFDHSDIPRLNARWDASIDGVERPLWVHDIVRQPSVRSSGSSTQAASHAHVVVSYEGRPLPVRIAFRGGPVFTPDLEVTPSASSFGETAGGLTAEETGQAARRPAVHHRRIVFSYRALTPATPPDDALSALDHANLPIGVHAVGSMCRESVAERMLWVPRTMAPPGLLSSRAAANQRRFWLRLEDAAVGLPFAARVLGHDQFVWWRWLNWTVIADILIDAQFRALGSGHLLYWDDEEGEWDMPSVAYTSWAAWSIVHPEMIETE